MYICVCEMCEGEGGGGGGGAVVTCEGRKDGGEGE